MKKYKIAISLLCKDDEALLMPCLASLFESDLKLHDFKLFCYDNASDTPMKEYLQSLTIDKWIHSSPINYGIVLPRITLYEEIIKEEYDFLLEIHADMVFPKIWLQPLLDIFDENTGILEPHIFQPKNGNIISSDSFETLLPRLLKDVIYTKCRQTHPWLINLKIVNKVGGYYDPIFSPQECEDDDFVYRILKNGLDIKSTGKSWVVHYGQKTRSKLLQSRVNDKIVLFTNKNNIYFDDFLKLFEIHPAYGF